MLINAILNKKDYKYLKVTWHSFLFLPVCV